MKKCTVLLVMALLLVSLAACGSDAPETTAATQPSQTTVPTEPEIPTPTEPEYPENFDPALCGPVMGLWHYTVTLDGSLMNMKDMEGSTSYDLIYYFGDDGSYHIGTNEADYQVAVSEYEALVTQYMIQSLYTKFYSECRLEGMSRWAIDKAWEEGKKAEAEAHTAAFLADLNLVEMLVTPSRSGNYYLESHRLYVSLGDGTYESYGFTRESANLILNDCDHAQDHNPLLEIFPMTLSPVKNEAEDETPDETIDGSTDETNEGAAD